jgi:hypothetical protein
MIDEIIKEKSSKCGSLDDLDIHSSSGLIIVPKVIGVYQEDRNTQAYSPLLEIVEKKEILMLTGQDEKIPIGLISIIYDPTIISEDLLGYNKNKDPLGRLKYLDYSCDMPDFSEKNAPEISFFKDAVLNPSKENITLLNRAIEHLKLSKEEFGLTRFEALYLRFALDFIVYKEGKSGLIIDPFEIKMKNSLMKFIHDYFKKGEEGL